MGVSGRSLAQLALLLLALACHSLPTARATTRSDLPAKFQVWTLLEVEGQLVYAVNRDDAAKAAALAGEVGDDFRARTGREPCTRLLIVADHDVWLPGGDLCRRLELVSEGESALQPVPAQPEESAPVALGGASENHDTDNDLPSACEKMRAESAKLGLDPRDMVCMISHPIPLTRLVLDFGMPSGARVNWDWAVMLPTRHCLEGGMTRVMDAAMKKELSFGQRLLMAPMMPFARSAAVDELIEKQKSLLFELHAAAQADWSVEQREKFNDEYEAALDSGAEARPSPPSNVPPAESKRAP